MRFGIILERMEPDWPTLDLLRAASNLGIKVEPTRISDLTTHIRPKNVEVLLRRKRVDQFDGFIVRGIGWPTNLDRMEHRLNLIQALEAMQKPVMNPSAGITLARDKERTLTLLASKGFRVPETYVSESLSVSMRASRRFRQAVVKPLQGSRGLGVITVDGEDSAFYALRAVAQSSGVFYLQDRISGSEGTLRVFTVGKKVLGRMLLKPRQGSWKSNIAQGGISSNLGPSASDSRLALEASHSLGLWYSGVDLLVDAKGERYVAEVNASPNWRAFSKVTKTDPARDILQYLSKKVTTNRAE